MLNKNEFLVLSISLVSVVLLLLGIVTNSWGVYDLKNVLGVAGGKYSYGLWKGCTKPESPDSDLTCKEINLDRLQKPVKQSLQACRAFAIISLVLVFLSAASVIVRPHNKQLHMYLYLASFISGMITLIIWGSKLKHIGDHKSEYSYSFYLFSTGVFVSLLATFASHHHHDLQNKYF